MPMIDPTTGKLCHATHKGEPMNKKLLVRDPQTAIETVESWAGMPSDARKRRAAKAGNVDDRDELHVLLESYILAFSRSGTDTSPLTLDAYWRGASRLLDWCAANGLKAHKIEGEEVSRFVASMGELSPKSRQLYISGSKAMVASLRWAGMGKGDPFVMADGKPIRVRDPNPAEDKPDPYTTAEIKKLLDGADARERALILLGSDGGLRLAEIQSLHWSGVDAERNLLKFTGKGSKLARVTVTNRVIQALEQIDREGDQVFNIKRRRLQQIFTNRCIDAGVAPRGVHNLRHTCGTRLYEITKDLLVVKRHLRHSSTVTSEIYAHLADGDYFEAVKKLETNGYA